MFRRRVEVDDERDIVNINPARSNVGGDENRGAAISEPLKRAGPGTLALVAVDAIGVDAHPAQLLHLAVHSTLR